MRKPQPFGKYLLLDRIAVGGMAEVFAAKTFGVEGFERLVAIKRILPTMVEDDEFVAMFIDEARIAARLSHATVTQIFELGRHEETYYIAMEYVSGRDVRLLIDKFKKREEKVPVHLAAFIMARVAEGLDYAHSKKDENGNPLDIIHRDVSPQNILVSYDGEVKIIDFGIAKSTGRNQKTQVGILKGKFAYMSPEQVRGSEIDHRSDLFSAGVMLYELLTGVKLFSGESDFSTLEKVRAGTVRAPSELNPNIPTELERICLKALAKEREERYQNGSEMQEDLLRYLYKEGEIFSTKALAKFMVETFAEEYRKENDRQKRWWSTQTEESVEFEPARTGGTSPRANRPQKVRIGAATDEVEPTPSDRTAIVDGQGKPVPTKGQTPASELGDQATQVKGVNLDLAASLAKDGNAAPSKAPPPPVLGLTPVENVPVAMAAPAPVKKPSRAPLALVALLLVCGLGGFAYWKIKPTPVRVSIVSSDKKPIEGLSVEVDGQELNGTTPFTVSLGGGNHRLTAAAPNFEPFAGKTFETPSTSAIEIQLKAIPPPPPPVPTTPDQPSTPTGTNVVPGGAGTPAPAPGGTVKSTEPKRPLVKNDLERSLDKLKGTQPPRVIDNTPPAAAPKLGSLQLITDPPGAMFSLNGKIVPGKRTPYTMTDLPTNEPASVLFVLQGYEKQTLTADVKGGAVTTVKATLKAMQDAAPTPSPAPVAAMGTGTINILCVPVASIVIDGKDTGKRTALKPVPVSVPAGHHTVSCRGDTGKSSVPQDYDVANGSSVDYRKPVPQ
jgi:serine/threonine protein kinase